MSELETLKVTQVKSKDTLLPPHHFPSVFNSILPNSAPLQDISLQNLSNLDLTFQGHSMLNLIALFMLPIYVFLLVFNSNLWPLLYSFMRYEASKCVPFA